MSTPEFRTLAEACAWYRAWLVEAALPLWADAGVDATTGAFHEALSVHGAPVAAPRRARVQARQTFVFATAALSGFGDRWAAIARRGFGYYQAHYQRPDGLFAFLADASGRVLDDTAALYEQDFSLLAMAALTASGEPDLAAEAERLMAALQPRKLALGGFRELGSHPFQSNAHMHLLEGLMAWAELDLTPDWSDRAAEVVALSLDRFIDQERGFLREFFDDRWRPAPGEDGRRVEPGHQFEWAWLLERWGQTRGEPRALAAARGLFASGLRGVDPARGVAVNALRDDLTIQDGMARLWPQTEYLKAALILGHEAEALRAANGLAHYLDTPARGAWRDKLRPDGSFVEEPAPATSFYHIIVAVLELLGHG